MSKAEITKIGYGTWGVGGFDVPDHSRSMDSWSAALSHFIDKGGRHIDTAPVYAQGFSEQIIGNVLSKLTTVSRKEIFLSSKVAADNLRLSDVFDSACKSIERMGVHYIDLLYIHSPNEEIPLEETLDAFLQLKDKGLIKNIGVSNFNKIQLEQALYLSSNQIFANQLHYNLIVREAEISGIVDFCQANSVKLVAWRPLQPITINLSHLNIEPLFKRGIYEILDGIAYKYNATPAQISIAWLLAQENVHVVVQSLDKNHIEDILSASEINLSAEDYEKLRVNFPVQLSRSDSMPLTGTDNSNNSREFKPI